MIRKTISARHKNDVETFLHVDKHRNFEYILSHSSTSQINKTFFIITNESF